MAVPNSTAERLCYTLTSPPISWMTQPKVSASRKYTSDLHQTPAASSRHRTIACSQLSSALTTRLPYLSDAESSLICLVSTTWSKTDRLVIVSLKARTSIVTQPHLASECSALHFNARSHCKISSYNFFNSLPKTHHVLRVPRQEC